MSKQETPKRILFYGRHSQDVPGVWLVECSLCVWDVVDWCETHKDRDCGLPDLMRTHARFHGGVARVVDALRP